MESNAPEILPVGLVQEITFIQVTQPGSRPELTAPNTSKTQACSETRTTARAHVMRDYHRNKRLALSLKHQSSKKSEVGARPSGRVIDAEGVLDASHHSALVRPNYALPYLANLIPYSCLQVGGPVLYLAPSSWPFPRPFKMSGSGEAEVFGRSVFPRQSIWMPNATIPDGNIIKGPLLDGEVLRWISHTPECFRYRGEIINWVQERLKSKEGAVNNSTIGAIMTLAMWENGEDTSFDLKHHINGLERIVRFGGGLQGIEIGPEMSAKIILFDNILAVACGQDPCFPSLPGSLPALPLSNTSRDHLFAGSPLYGDGDFSVVWCEDRRHEVVLILEEAWRRTNMVMFAESQVEELEPCGLPYLSVNEEPESGNQVLFVLYHSALIYQQALLSTPILFDSQYNTSHLVRLFASLNSCSGAEFWLGYPGVLLWVLLVGCAAAARRTERSYFMMFLAKIGIFTEPKCWFETQSAISRFLEIQKRTRVYTHDI